MEGFVNSTVTSTPAKTRQGNLSEKSLLTYPDLPWQNLLHSNLMYLFYNIYFNDELQSQAWLDPKQRREDADAADEDVAHMMDDLSSDRAFMCRVGLGEINRKMGVVMTQPR